MKERVGERFPQFTQVESDMLRGSIDFLGLNHYTSVYGEEPIVSSEISYQSVREMIC